MTKDTMGRVKMIVTAELYEDLIALMLQYPCSHWNKHNGELVRQLNNVSMYWLNYRISSFLLRIYRTMAEN